MKKDYLTTVEKNKDGNTFDLTTRKKGAYYVATTMPIDYADTGTAIIKSFSSTDMFTKRTQVMSIQAKGKTLAEAHAIAKLAFDEADAGGMLKERARTDIRVGSILFLDGYGKTKGSHGNRHMVYKIEKTDWNTKYHTIELDTLVMDVKDHVRHYSELFGIGIYYDDEVVEMTEDELLNLILDAQEAKKQRLIEEQEAQKQKAEQRRIDTINLKKSYSYLQEVSQNDNGTETKKNVMTELKRAFPKVKFSMKKSDWKSYRLTWTDGATEEEVEKITRKYKSWSSDHTGDYYDPTPSLFNEIFGGLKFFFVDREMSKEVEQLMYSFAEKRKEEYNGDEMKCYDEFRRVYRHTTIPEGASNFRMVEGEEYNYDSRSSYKLEFDTATKEAKEAPERKEDETEVETEGVEYVDYSEKAFAIIGDTKPLKDVLKDLGGRFNNRLKCGAGWIFSKKKEEELRAILGNKLKDGKTIN